MGKIAFVFAGQGDQFPGMGRELAQEHPAANQVFQMCDAHRPGTSAQCFGGTEEELKETKNTQPCLFAMELAATEVLLAAGIKPDAVAGFSLGEVVAATVAGAADKETGFRLVCKRGELMQQAAEEHETAMAAVVRLTADQVNEVCKDFDQVYPVNFNCPGQITVAGLKSQMPDFSAKIKEAGGRALPLKVKGAFHSPFMDNAAEAFAAELAQADLKENEITLYSNVTGKPYAGDIREILAKQIKSPVQWETIIRNMIAEGIDTFIEIGPGQTLTGMIRKINSTVKTYSVSQMETVLAEVKPC